MPKYGTPKKLEYFSTGVQEGGGWITSHLQGKEIECFMQDGTWLIVRCTDGHEARIGWQDKNGNQLKGSAFLENLDVRVCISGAGLSGVAGNT